MTPVIPEPLLGYHPCSIGCLTSRRDPAVGQCQTGSLTGAVASARTQRPHGALLPVGTGIRCCMYRIGGRLRRCDDSHTGAAVGIQPLQYWVSNKPPRPGGGTLPDGEIDWGGRLRKGIGGAQRFPQNGRKPFAECKGRRELDCDTDGWSRYESRA